MHTVLIKKGDVMPVPLVVALNEREIEALEICKTFFKDNDALPTGRTLGEKMCRSRSIGDRCLMSLRELGILELNEQGGLKFTRRDYSVVKAVDGRTPRFRKI